MNEAKVNVLIIFAKYPEPGRVKTRLAKALGKEKAASIYKKMAEHVIGRCAESSSYSTVIFYAPPQMRDEMKSWLGSSLSSGIGPRISSGIGPRISQGLQYKPQQGKGLGERMKNAFETVLKTHAERAIIIGTDCIEITPEIIEEGFNMLDKVDGVIGPATDGGYYLIGLKKPSGDLFEGIEWSTDKVLEQTLEKIRTANAAFGMLKPLNDIDTIEDILTVTPSILSALGIDLGINKPIEKLKQ